MNKYRNYIIGYLSKTRKKVANFLEEELRNHGLEELIPSHGSILSVLYEQNRKLTMREIADLIGKDKSTVTPLVNKLVDIGYIEKKKCKEDKRITYIVLTEKGETIKPIFDTISKKLIDTAYRGFTEEEEDTLAKLLNKLNKNFC